MKLNVPSVNYMITFTIATIILAAIVKIVVPDQWKSYFRV